MAPRAKGTGCIFKPRGSSFFWIKYKGVDGRYHYESTKSSRKTDAQRLLTDRLGDIQRGVPVTPQIGKLTFEEAAQGVIDDFKNNGKRSLNVVARRIRKHLRPFFGGRRMAHITPADVAAFVTKRKADVIVTRRACVFR